MQIVTPIDIESALAAELDARLESINAHATPAPDDIGAGAVVVQAIGGGEQTAVSDLYDVVIYAFASTYDAALATGRAVCGAVRILWVDGAVARVDPSGAEVGLQLAPLDPCDECGRAAPAQ